MAKSKIQEKHTLSVEGFLNISEDKTMKLEVEDIGAKNLDELFTRFNGENIKISITLNNEITE